MANTDMSKRPTRSWPGLGPNTLVVDFDKLFGIEAEEDVDPNASGRGSAMKQTDNELSAELEVKNTTQHKSIIKARNEYYNVYKQRFASSIERIMSTYNELRKEEVRFSEYWTRNLAEITKKHI